MDTNNYQFWMMIASIVIAICFIVMAVALIAIALIVNKIVGIVKGVEEKVEPLMGQVNAIGEQGKQISVQFTEISEHLSTATQYFSDSAGLIKDEVVEIKQLVGITAHTAKDKIELVSNTIDRTHAQVAETTDFIQEKVVIPAREAAAIMAGVRKGLEVLFAPSPKRIDRAYTDDEMFIG
jgi:uncharacterized protein YoxC